MEARGEPWDRRARAGDLGAPPAPPWRLMEPVRGIGNPAGHRLLFADSSGNPRMRSGINSYYVVGGLTGSAEELDTLSKLLYGLKLGLAPEYDPSAWEVHSVRVTHGRRYYPLRPRTERRRLAMFEAFVRIICESGVTLFGVAIDNEKVFGRLGPGADIMDVAWTFLLERFEMYLRDQEGGPPGYVVADRAGGADMQQIHTLVHDAVRRRNPMSGVRASRVAGVEFVDSASSPMVQMSDVSAYVTSRQINGDARFGDMSARLLGRMWVSKNGTWRGWKSI